MNEKRFPYCKFTIEEEKQIIKEYENGNSLAAVGKKFGCDPSTVKNILKEEPYLKQEDNFLGIQSTKMLLV